MNPEEKSPAGLPGNDNKLQDDYSTARKHQPAIFRNRPDDVVRL